MVNVIGVRTLDTVPGLNRHRRKALVAALSRIALPVLGDISALVTDPLEASTVMMHTPLPVNFERRASYGYSGRGALTATALADDIDIGPAAGSPCGFGRAIGAAGFEGVCLGFGGGVGCSSTNSGTSVGGGGASTGSGSIISSGGGVGSGGAVSNVTSATASTASTSAGGGSTGLIAAIPIANAWIVFAAPSAANTCQRGAGL